MASGAHVTLRGRFSEGTNVQLIRVAGPHVLSPEGGEVVDEQTVKSNDQGVSEVRFTRGVDENARYFVRGLQDGAWLNVRVRGRSEDDLGEMFQPPVQPTPVRLGTGGQYSLQARTRESPPAIEAQPHLGMHQSPKGTVLRSDTPHGEAHPVDLPEPAPYSRQEDVKDGTVQMSDTETGRAAPLEVGPQRQEDVPKGMWQRSDTPTGVATPLPKGDAVKAQEEKESIDAKERRGEPTQAAASPISHAKPVTGASEKQSAERHEELSRSVVEIAAEQRADTVRSDPQADRENTSGLTADGQPVSEDVAATAGVEPADKPAEPIRRSSSRSSGSSGASRRSSSKSTTAKKEN